MNIKGYEFELDYKANALEVTTPEGKWFSMNCEGMTEELIKSSLYKFKFYPEHYLKKLLDKGKSVEEAYKETQEVLETVKQMKRVILSNEKETEE